MTKTIDLKKTLAQTNGRLSVEYIAKQVTRSSDAVRKWLRGGNIPETVVNRLMEVLAKNDVDIIYKDVD